MIDEAGVVAAVARVEHRVIVEHEQERMVAPFAVVVAAVRLLVRDRLPPVLIDLPALANREDCEGSTPLDLRAAYFVARRLGWLDTRCNGLLHGLLRW